MTLNSDSLARQRSTTRAIRLSSTIYFPTVRAYREAIAGQASAEGQIVDGSENSYGIEGNPSLHELQEAVSQREGGKYTYLYSNGLAAISAVFDCFLAPGDHVLVPDAVYGPTRLYCDYLEEHKSIGVGYYDSENLESLRNAITSNTKVIYIESPASVTFELTDYEAVVEIAKRRNIITIADNTWASLQLSHPLRFGVDISITSLTKYAAGYSDVFMGAITLTDDDLNALLNRHHNVTGAYASPFDATLVHRGLESLDVRLRQHGANARQISELLKDVPNNKIYFPEARSALFTKYFTDTNGLLSIELSRRYSDEELERFVEQLQLFRLGESWGGTHSLVLIFQPEDFADRHNPPKNTVLRIHSGLEPIADQIEDLKRAFASLNT